MLLFKKKKTKRRPTTMPPRPKNVPTMQQTPPVPKNHLPKQEPPPKPKAKEEAPVKRVDYEKEFLNVFGRLTYHHRAYDVWRDFVVMLACSISNAIDKRYFDQREEMYLKIINRYDKNEQSLFPELAAYTVLALESNYEQDFLGEMYMRLRLGNDANGQFFTPYHVCQLMADIAEEDIVAQVKKDGYISINDPCCGAGATLIAGINSARRKLEKEGLNYQNHVLVVAQDIDMTVAMMCYIQLSLLGVAGYVKIGNSLTDPITEKDSLENYWFTPMYFSDTWIMRRFFRGDKL